MKSFIPCFLLALVGLTCATPALPYRNYYKNLYIGTPYFEKARVLLESLASSQQGQNFDDENDDDDDDDDIADLQAVFNVLEQVDEEKAAANGNSATAQLTGMLGGTVLNLAKGYLKNKYCTEEQEVRAMVQELIGEQSEGDDSDDARDRDDKLRAELQTLFKALKMVEAKLMQDESNARIEGWLKKLRKSIKKRAKQYLC